MSLRVLIFGTFDELHPGHRFLLREACKRGGLHVVVARDSSVLRIKKRPPVQDEDARKHGVEQAAPEATVILGDPVDFLAPVRAIKPDLILLGYDQSLPPGIAEIDLPCPIERVPAFGPERYKSSLRRKKQE